MASRIITQLVSDLSGNEIEDGGGETVEFAYRGANYSIDLTTDEAADFDEAIKQYLDRGTKRSSARRSTASVPASKSDAKAIRAWAQEQGIDAPSRGRIPTELRDQYDAAH